MQIVKLKWSSVSSVPPRITRLTLVASPVT